MLSNLNFTCRSITRGKHENGTPTSRQKGNFSKNIVVGNTSFS